MNSFRLALCTALTLTLSTPAFAASSATCKVEVFSTDGSREVIRIPNLPPYTSFSMGFCNFLSADSKISLMTAVLKGGMYVTLYHEGKSVLKTNFPIRPLTPYQFENTVNLTPTTEALVSCSVFVDPNDVSSVPKCQ